MNNKNRNKNLDKKYKIFLDTIKLYPDQLKQAWDEVNRIEFPDEFKYIDKVVISAMGGSALGARIIDSLLINRIRVPVEIFNQYHIPNYADEKTLFIAYSYSGNTEETINSLNEAISKEIKTIVVSTGGKLEEIAKNHKLISYTINPYNNPSKQPRMGLGYAIGAIFAIFSKLSLVNIFDEEIESALVTMQKAISNFDEDVELHDNLAKKYADKVDVVEALDKMVDAVQKSMNCFEISIYS